MHQPWAVFNQLCWLYLIEYSCTYYSACSSIAVMLQCDFHMYSAQQTWMYSIHQVHYLHVHNLYIWVITGYVGDFDQNLVGAFHLCLFPINFHFIYISKWLAQYLFHNQFDMLCYWRYLTNMQVIMSSFYSSQLLLKVSNFFLPESEIQEVFC